VLVVVSCGVEVGGVAASPSVGSTWGFADRERGGFLRAAGG
jgi:hypothetical protein